MTAFRTLILAGTLSVAVPATAQVPTYIKRPVLVTDATRAVEHAEDYLQRRAKKEIRFVATEAEAVLTIEPVEPQTLNDVERDAPARGMWGAAFGLGGLRPVVLRVCIVSTPAPDRCTLLSGQDRNGKNAAILAADKVKKFVKDNAIALMSQ